MNIEGFFASLKTDKSWTFTDLKRNDVNYLTHGYHRYPAKFIPQLARRLIDEFSDEGDRICDPFVGGGTTLVEGLIAGRRVIAVDANPVAYLISKAKVTCIDPVMLDKVVSNVFSKLDSTSMLKKKMAVRETKRYPSYEKIRYWFKKKTIEDLSLILSVIDDVQNDDVSVFLKCGFSHILKNCSRWKMAAIKPTRDRTKKIPKAIPTFRSHIEHMAQKNLEFYQTLPKRVRENTSKYAKVILGDCRKIPCVSKKIALIVTSPPYVTSYDYARTHQLSMFWLYPEVGINKIRENLIGYEHPKAHDGGELRSDVGNRIVEELKNNGNGYARSVRAYFIEMQQSLREFKRVLMPDGTACITIGNTVLGGVDVLNAEVLAEIALNQGFLLRKAVKREVPTTGKFLPSCRNPQTGSFVSIGGDKKFAYPYEFILMFKRC